jgi:hypothetical protein
VLKVLRLRYCLSLPLSFSEGMVKRRQRHPPPAKDPSSAPSSCPIPSAPSAAVFMLQHITSSIPSSTRSHHLPVSLAISRDQTIPLQRTRHSHLHWHPLFQPTASSHLPCICVLAALLLSCSFLPLALSQKLSHDKLFYCSMPESNLAVAYCGGATCHQYDTLFPCADALFQEITPAARTPVWVHLTISCFRC